MVSFSIGTADVDLHFWSQQRSLFSSSKKGGRLAVKEGAGHEQGGEYRTSREVDFGWDRWVHDMFMILHPWKRTNVPFFKGLFFIWKYIFQPLIFGGHVSFRGSNCLGGVFLFSPRKLGKMNPIWLDIFLIGLKPPTRYMTWMIWMICMIWMACIKMYVMSDINVVYVVCIKYVMSFMLGIICMLCMSRIVHIPSIGTPVLPFIHALSICEYGDVLPTTFAATYLPTCPR